MAERASTACRCRPNGFPGSPNTSTSTTSPSRGRNAAARLRSRAPKETRREHGQGAIPVALVAAQARFGDGKTRAETGCACGSNDDGESGGGAGAETRAAAGRFAAGSRLRVPGFPAPWSGREAAPVRAEKTFPRSAFQCDGRARHLYRRLLQAGSYPRGDAEDARARQGPALRRGKEGARGAAGRARG